MFEQHDGVLDLVIPGCHQCSFPDFFSFRSFLLSSRPSHFQAVLCIRLSLQLKVADYLSKDYRYAFLAPFERFTSV